MPRASAKARLSPSESVSDKRARYDIEIVPGRSSERETVVRLDQKDGKGDPIFLTILPGEVPGVSQFRYQGPPWKRPHANLYFLAALDALRDGSAKSKPKVTHTMPQETMTTEQCIHAQVRKYCSGLIQHAHDLRRTADSLENEARRMLRSLSGPDDGTPDGDWDAVHDELARMLAPLSKEKRGEWRRYFAESLRIEDKAMTGGEFYANLSLQQLHKCVKWLSKASEERAQENPHLQAA